MAAMADRTVEELCENADPQSEVEHLIVCPGCGQIFDCRDAAQVTHHAAADHTILLT
jgi:hypothetical protein